jgi:hypothetical protein
MDALKKSIASEAPAKDKKPRKAAVGQKEMLLPIEGKRAKAETNAQLSQAVGHHACYGGKHRASPCTKWQASCDGLAGQEAILKCVSKQIIRSTQMKHQRHFERAPAAREALQIGELIADLDRIVHMLNSDIAAEEEWAQVFERCQPEYPILARMLAARRDNLMSTIAALERRLAAIYRARLDEVSA